jgi:hypothetical protein
MQDSNAQQDHREKNRFRQAAQQTAQQLTPIWLWSLNSGPSYRRTPRQRLWA